MGARASKYLDFFIDRVLQSFGSGCGYGSRVLEVSSAGKNKVVCCKVYVEVAFCPNAPPKGGFSF